VNNKKKKIQNIVWKSEGNKPKKIYAYVVSVS
jgi:hypothetical protein